MKRNDNFNTSTRLTVTISTSTFNMSFMSRYSFLVVACSNLENTETRALSLGDTLMASLGLLLLSLRYLSLKRPFPSSCVPLHLPLSNRESRFR